MTPQDLLSAFAPAISGGKIYGRWRAKYETEGLAILTAVPDAESISEALFRIKNGIDRPKCATCGGHVKFSHKHHEYSRFCSPRCGQLNPEVRIKLKETNLKKYGVENPGIFGSDKFKDAMQEKYGADTPMRSELLKDKVKATNLERYGAENVFASEQGKKKIVDTMMKNYGVSCSMKDPGVKEKFRLPDGSWKPAVTNVELRRSNKLVTDTTKVKQRLQEAGFTIIEKRGTFANHKNKHTVRHECGTIFESSLTNGMVPICRKCNPKLCGTSLLQKKVEDFLLSLNVDFKVGVRILNRKELDILIPSANIGLEINGLFWHSTQSGKDPNYHLDKTEAADKLGISLIHLFEDDLTYRWEVVQSMLKVRLGLAKKILAENCFIKKISKAEASVFCNQYHLKKSSTFDFAFGLKYNNELVCIGTFKKLIDETIELVRFCSIENVEVIGGLSKILSKMPKVCTLIINVDRSYSNGKDLERIGFTLQDTKSPSCFNFISPDNLRMSIAESSKGSDFNQIWDCGQLVYSLDLKLVDISV